MIWVDGLRCVRSKSTAQQVRVQTAARIAAVMDGPFKLNTEQLWWSVLETDQGHVALGLLPVSQGHRRLVRQGWRGYLGWSTHEAKFLPASWIRATPLR